MSKKLFLCLGIALLNGSLYAQEDLNDDQGWVNVESPALLFQKMGREAQQDKEPDWDMLIDGQSSTPPHQSQIIASRPTPPPSSPAMASREALPAPRTPPTLAPSVSIATCMRPISIAREGAPLPVAGVLQDSKSIHKNNTVSSFMEKDLSDPLMAIPMQRLDDVTKEPRGKTFDAYDDEMPFSVFVLEVAKYCIGYSSDGE